MRYLGTNLQCFHESAYLLMMLFLQRIPVFLFILLWLTGFHINGEAQCINRFPYTEDFEQTNGGWTTGGTASDWTWGIPKKSKIYDAGSTHKSWVTGGLTGNSYNENEASWLQSPCFDFSSLQDPFLSFLVNWDTEQDYDGAALQYSTDNGITWQSAGAYGDIASGCNNNYWFNSNNIRYGYQAEGWSGSGSNGGSKSWVTAYHSFTQLGGKATVIFRFVFGAGKINNNFNGFAIDNFYVDETVKDKVTIVYTCSSTPNQVSFAPQSNGCIVPSSMQWDFGDAESGNANTAQGASVSHEFSATGSYTVIFTGINSNNETVAGSQIIIIPEIIATLKTPILCHGNTGIAEAYVINTTAAASYTWSTFPATTTPAASLAAGTYQVFASVAGGCQNTTSITLTEPTALEHQVQTTPADCNNLNGVISIAESGGIAPYQYAWQGAQSITLSAGNLPSGNYSILVTDNKSCTDKIDIVLPKTPSSLTQTYDATVPDCGLNNGMIKLTTSGGIPDYTYQWMPDISTGTEAQGIPSGNYTVVATDAGQCRDTAFITLASKPVTVMLGNDTFVCKGQTLLLKPAGNFATYLWNDGTTTPEKSISREGYYSMTATNAGGCHASDTIHVSVGCGDLVFPSVFTPNGDGLNEQFGPSGGLSLVSSYQLLVYNRFGNLVFQSVNPYQKWRGDNNGKILTGTYTFLAAYTYDGARKIKKGTIVLFL